MSDSATLGTRIPILQKNCPSSCYFTPYSFLQPQLAIFSMPQDEIYLTNLLDPYLFVPISEISFFFGSLSNLSPTSSLENWKSITN